MSQDRRTARHAQEERDRMVRKMAEQYEEMGYTWVHADIEEYPTPPRLERSSHADRCPDVYCFDLHSRPIICEVETEDTIEDPHTLSQWLFFDAYAKQRQSRLHIAVPEGCYDLVEDRLIELGIEGAVVFSLFLAREQTPSSAA